MYNSDNSVDTVLPEYSKGSDDIVSKEHVICEKTEKSLPYSNSSKTKRSLENLNLMDAFLFSASIEKIHDAEVIARIIIERTLGRKLGKVIIESEKQLLGIDTNHRGVRLDLC